MAKKRKKSTTGASILKGLGKANFTKKTKKGGTLSLYSKKGVAGIAVFKKMYRRKSDGKRRVLVITTTKRVIK